MSTGSKDDSLEESTKFLINAAHDIVTGDEKLEVDMAVGIVDTFSLLVTD